MAQREMLLVSVGVLLLCALACAGRPAPAPESPPAPPPPASVRPEEITALLLRDLPTQDQAGFRAVVAAPLMPPECAGFTEDCVLFLAQRFAARPTSERADFVRCMNVGQLVRASDERCRSTVTDLEEMPRGSLSVRAQAAGAPGGEGAAYGSGGYVHGYTRSNGTVVQGYTRGGGRGRH